MSINNIWSFLDAIEKIPIIAQQPEKLYEYYASLKKEEKGFEIGIAQCFAEGDMRTVEVAKERLEDYLAKRGSVVVSSLMETVNSMVLGETQAKAQTQFEDLVSGFVFDALNYIDQMRAEPKKEEAERAKTEKTAPREKVSVNPLSKPLEQYGDFLTVNDLTAIFGCSPRTVFNWERDGLIVNVATTSDETNSVGRKKRGQEKRYRKEDVLKSVALQQKLNEKR